MLNSGRLESMSATASPWPTPRPARPPAIASTRPSSSLQVSDTASSGVRTDTTSGWRAAVARTAWANVTTSVPDDAAARLVVLLSMVSSWLLVTLVSRQGCLDCHRACLMGHYCAVKQCGAQRGTWKPGPVSVEMSLLRPMTNSRMIRAKPITPARSMTLNGMRLPRTFSASAQNTCPPSRGRNGNRLMTPRESEISPSTSRARLGPTENDCSVTVYPPTTPDSCLRSLGWKMWMIVETVVWVTYHM